VSCRGRAVSALAPARAALDAASAEVGRDRSSLEVTVGINVAFPELGDVPDNASDPAKNLTGSNEAIAASMRTYADAGVGHLITWLYPFNAESVRRLAEVAKLARG